MAILSINNLTKNYGKIRALDKVSFEVPPKTVFGILGPNGSGKTTLLGIIMDVIKASGGSFTWAGDGLAPNDLRKKIGTLLETPNFYHYLSAEKNLAIAAKIKGRGEGDIEKVLRLVNLYERKDSKFSTYSLGMKQRLAIAAALLGDPEILVFDEPTNGLDPAGIAEIRELIRQLYKGGKTIIMASHILDEVEKVCTHVAIIQKGVLKTVSSVAALMDTSAENTAVNVLIDISSADNQALKNIVQQLDGVESVTAVEGELHLVCSEKTTGESVNRFCFEKGIVLNKLTVKRKSLETRFLEITGRQSDK
ncbi:MAG: ATP-binding cassette domain-containing protein [Chitinophagaceae bacterium]|nr:ATP-binding cassette domain-containing protein [Chitinophagaceae bacterium]MBK9483728.1 ATP-binding cassette domain-containing protein [Chitinophagaceae bacterium]MBL0200808.1 ATP-binding cassette domain-containing protein [Chitinophagaceae bacterium]